MQPSMANEIILQKGKCGSKKSGIGGQIRELLYSF